MDNPRLSVPHFPVPNWPIVPVLPALALLLATFDLSIGLSPDSVRYLEAAENFRRTGALGEQFLLWPPLYPALLSLHPDATTWAALIARLGAFATVLGLWAIGRQVIVSRLALTLGLFAFACFPHFTMVFGHVWSETVYIPLTVWLAYFWTRWLDGGRGLIAACVLLAFAMLTRHVGVVMAIAMGTTAMLDRRRLKALALIGLASIPYALWVARTYRISGTYAGPRAPLPNSDVFQQLEMFGRVFSHWLVPHIYPLSGGVIVALAFLLLFGACLVHFYRQRQMALLFATLFVLGHSVLTIYSASRLTLDVNARTLFPIVWAVLLVGLWLAEKAIGLLAGVNARLEPWVYIAVGFYCLFWFSAPNTLIDALI